MKRFTAHPQAQHQGYILPERGNFRQELSKKIFVEYLLTAGTSISDQQSAISGQFLFASFAAC
ncbi:MAG: hypothetical protein SVT52_05300 [Planctomycetota bacterium]|nr:hypothetical protein [Planctomycetota bacterium]